MEKAYEWRSDGSIDLVQLFDSRLEENPGAGTTDVEHLREARRLLKTLEERRPICSRQVAELAVIMAEGMLTHFNAYASIGRKLRKMQ